MELNPEIIYAGVYHYINNPEFRYRYGNLLKRIIENHSNKHLQYIFHELNNLLLTLSSVSFTDLNHHVLKSLPEAEKEVYSQILTTINQLGNELTAGYVAENLDAVFVAYELEKVLSADYKNPLVKLNALKRTIFEIENVLEQVKLAETRYDGGKVKELLERCETESRISFPLDLLTQDLPVRSGDIAMVAGYTAVGKTWFLLNSWVRSVQSNKKVIFISLELSHEQIIPRLATILSGKRITNNHSPVKFYNLETKTIEELEVPQGDIDELSEITVSFLNEAFFVEPPSFSIYDLPALIERYTVLFGNLDAIIIDGLELIEVPEARTKDLWQIVARAVLQLKSIARKYNIAILTMCQVQKAKETKETITLRDIAGAGEISRIASLVLTLNQTKDEYKAKVMRIFVAKQREGELKNTVYFVNTLFSIGKWLNCIKVTRAEDLDDIRTRIASAVREMDTFNQIDKELTFNGEDIDL